MKSLLSQTNQFSKFRFAILSRSSHPVHSSISFAASTSPKSFSTVTSNFNFLLDNHQKSSNSSTHSKYSWYIRSGVAGLLLITAFKMTTAEVHNKSAEKTSPKGSGLSPDEFRQFTLREVHPYNYNTKRYIFNVENLESHSNMIPVSSCVLFKYIGSDGKPVIRPYTPISSKAKNELTFLIKEYPQGIMSKHVANLKPGDTIEIKGPFPKLKYEANMKKHIGMIAGGTGITPMLQVIEKILENPQDKTQVDLVFANTSPRDILLKEVLERYVQTKSDRFKVHYIVDKPTMEGQAEKWNGSVGLVSASYLKQHLPAPGKDALVYVCGPPGFMNTVSGDKAPDKSQGELTGILKSLGYDKDMIYKF